ncbi:hypothetical protein [Bradyrhizobium sp. CCGUVB23]|uniref:hypothetical protein n=1 Tax=Bradyrhizobium sp. CCGUVB23 TaxID=2949630 RepID=UPI0020B2EDCE|nr:hypothetical protein [Bradyrhizobium sp. CCGUVB23]MCP3462139.1 hypothetical protein [Bradyrhizobium sp. CCGUVB23]
MRNRFARLITFAAALVVAPQAYADPLKNCQTVVECAHNLADKVDQLERAFEAANSRIQALEDQNATREAKAKQEPVPTALPADAFYNKRVIFTVPKTQRGTSVKIPESTIIEFCGGPDGCIVRLGMRDWDSTGRIASRHFLFFYNKDNKNWRSEQGDIEGSNSNNVPQHAGNAWACHFTDGEYVNNAGADTTADFGLLSTPDANADCVLTIEK